MSDVGDHARELHKEAAAMDPRAHRAWPAGPVGDAAWAGLTRLNVINNEMAYQGTSLILYDPRDLAAMAERTANAARLQGLLVSFENLMALAIAGWVSALRAAEVDVASGDETEDAA
jgi:hypothetical protein